MKFALNGALTIGTLDGANIEILNEVGADNIYIFGMTAAGIEALQKGGGYRPHEIYDRDPRVRRVLDSLKEDRFCPNEPGLFKWIYDSLLSTDHYFHLADFSSYLAARDNVWQDYSNRKIWLKISHQRGAYGPVLKRPGNRRVRRRDLGSHDHAAESNLTKVRLAMTDALARTALDVLESIRVAFALV